MSCFTLNAVQVADFPAAARSLGDMETLRAITDQLWVADQKSAAILGSDFDLTVNCTGELPVARGSYMHLDQSPTGKTNHSWTASDLNRIVATVSEVIADGGTVLVFCKRGVSRSATAAAAVLLAAGVVSSIQEAIDLVRAPTRKPANQCIGGLRKWFDDRKQLSLF